MTRPLATTALAAIFALAGASRSIWSQAPDPNPTFDVVSIKPAQPNATGMSVATLPNGRFVMVNGQARMLIQMAYPSETNELVGAPAWTQSDRFDVDARSNGGTSTSEQTTLMMRAMMADRFKLAAHYETKEIPSFALVLAREDGRLGPKIHPAEVDCAALSVAARNNPAPTPPPMKADGSPACGVRMSKGVLMAGGMRMAAFARSISGSTGRLMHPLPPRRHRSRIVRTSPPPCGSSSD